MEIGEALFSILSNYSALTALVGKRIYPDKMPQTVTYPAIVYQQISDIPEHTLTTDTAIDKVVIQVDVWATTRAVTKSVAKQIKTALAAYSGTHSDIFINAILRKSEIDDYEIETSLYNTKIDFLIIFNN